MTRVKESVHSIHYDRAECDCQQKVGNTQQYQSEEHTNKSFFILDDILTDSDFPGIIHDKSFYLGLIKKAAQLKKLRLPHLL